jgi:2-C-methyl-D-erythritol 4-phosphate cytidylyltransferase
VKAGALLLCAGRGERMGGDKALAPLAGRPLFVWSLETLLSAPSVHGVVVVGPVARLREAAGGAGLDVTRVVAWTEGGRERQQSVAAGLKALPPEYELVVVHDSARALVTADVVRRVVADALDHGAAIAAVPLEDTLKRGALHVVEQTVPRAGLFRAQTPQAFRRDWLAAAHQAAQGLATDDAALLEADGRRVRLSEGDPLNFKITTPRDLALAEAWLAARAATREAR